MCHFITVPWVNLQCVTVAFPGYTYSSFLSKECEHTYSKVDFRFKLFISHPYVSTHNFYLYM